MLGCTRQGRERPEKQTRGENRQEKALWIGHQGARMAAGDEQLMLLLFPFGGWGEALFWGDGKEKTSLVGEAGNPQQHRGSGSFKSYPVILPCLLGSLMLLTAR